MERTILHVDLNNFYASVECLYNPSLRSLPVAVCGDIEARHGIVLAKNNIAKSCGVKTGSTIAEAKSLCPALVTVPPHIDRYLRFSVMARDIYARYTDRIESFGIDECWLDVTGCKLHGDGRAIADEIRQSIKRELGVTASAGVSYNKIFAKMGSDYKKPDATTVITPENYRLLLWPLSICDLMFVGGATFRKLFLYNIKTIGDLARADCALISALLGKNGRLLWSFANGLDTSEVARADECAVIKSVGNSTTAPRDLVSADDIEITLRVLSNTVAARLRANRLKCTTVQIDVRNTALAVYTRQVKVHATYLSDRIFDVARSLFFKNHPRGVPVRSLGVRGTSLVPEYDMQLSFLDDSEQTLRLESLEKTLDSLRSRFGERSVVNGITMLDRSLSSFSPGSDHSIHPPAFAR